MINGDYILVVAPDDYPGKKYRGRYCYEHHLSWWLSGNKMPVPGEVIHHKNEDKHDNRIGNLELKTVADHNSDHNTITETNTECSHCKVPFRVRPCKLKNDYLFCSRRCIGLFNFTKRKRRSGNQVVR